MYEWYIIICIYFVHDWSRTLYVINVSDYVRTEKKSITTTMKTRTISNRNQQNCSNLYIVYDAYAKRK